MVTCILVYSYTHRVVRQRAETAAKHGKLQQYNVVLAITQCIHRTKEYIYRTVEALECTRMYH